MACTNTIDNLIFPPFSQLDYSTLRIEQASPLQQGEAGALFTA